MPDREEAGPEREAADDTERERRRDRANDREYTTPDRQRALAEPSEPVEPDRR